MFIFTRPSIINVDAFTQYQEINDFYSLKPAKDCYPTWWKHIKGFNELESFYPGPTLKTCTGLTDLYEQGYMLPLWTDIAIDVKNKEYKWQCADFRTSVQVHSPMQWNSYTDSERYGHIKFGAEWHLKTKENIKWMFIAPSWNEDPIPEIIIPPGILDFSVIPIPLNVQAFIDVRHDRNFIMREGTPIAHLIPITEKRTKIHNHVVSPEEYRRFISPHRQKFIGSFTHLKKLYKRKENSKCPFHF